MFKIFPWHCLIKAPSGSYSSKTTRPLYLTYNRSSVSSWQFYGASTYCHNLLDFKIKVFNALVWIQECQARGIRKMMLIIYRPADTSVIYNIVGGET